MVQGKYPARSHALRTIAELSKLIPESDRGKVGFLCHFFVGSSQTDQQKHAVFVQSAPVMMRHDTDRELPFHQEANFSYLTGCPTPNASLLVLFNPSSAASHDGADMKHYLFVPKADPLETMWSVAPPTLEESKERFDSDTIAYLDELAHQLDAAAQGGKVVLHTLPDTMEFPALPSALESRLSTFDRRTDLLLDAVQIARLVKDEYEIDLIREANRISSGAHEVLMRELGRFAAKRQADKSQGQGQRSRSGKEGVREWEVESENDAEALFVATCKRSGASQAYLPICASGTRASTLHYVCNDKLFPSTSTLRAPGDESFAPRQLSRGCCGSDGHDHAESASFHDGAFEPQVLLIDAGCEWLDYASDITRTIPVGNGGKYTEKAGQIYELVLKMQKETEAMVKPGVHWDTLHLHAHKVLVDGFLSLGIFKGEAEDILRSGITAAFYPHGLGHSLGLDVHDSRQYLKNVHAEIPVESKATPKLFTYLRIRRPLEAGMVLTVEPGCYFPPQLMDEHGVWQSEFVDKEKLEEYVSVGGVRIEDVVVVRENGVENLTTVGRDRAWVEAVCSGQE